MKLETEMLLDQESNRDDDLIIPFIHSGKDTDVSFIHFPYVSTLCGIDDVDVVFSGSTNGTICLWRRKQNKKFVPYDVLLGHSTSIVGFCYGTNEWDENCMTSVSVDGTCCVWLLEDSSCWRRAPKIARNIAPVKEMSSVPSKNTRFIILGGSLSRQVIVIDTWTMVIVSSVFETFDLSSQQCMLGFKCGAKNILKEYSLIALEDYGGLTSVAFCQVEEDLRCNESVMDKASLYNSSMDRDSLVNSNANPFCFKDMSKIYVRLESEYEFLISNLKIDSAHKRALLDTEIFPFKVVLSDDANYLALLWRNSCLVVCSSIVNDGLSPHKIPRMWGICMPSEVEGSFKHASIIEGHRICLQSTSGVYMEYSLPWLNEKFYQESTVLCNLVGSELVSVRPKMLSASKIISMHVKSKKGYLTMVDKSGSIFAFSVTSYEMFQFTFSDMDTYYNSDPNLSVDSESNISCSLFVRLVANALNCELSPNACIVSTEATANAERSAIGALVVGHLQGEISIYSLQGTCDATYNFGNSCGAITSMGYVEIPIYCTQDGYSQAKSRSSSPDDPGIRRNNDKNDFGQVGRTRTCMFLLFCGTSNGSVRVLEIFGTLTSASNAWTWKCAFVAQFQIHSQRINICSVYSEIDLSYVCFASEDKSASLFHIVIAKPVSKTRNITYEIVHKFTFAGHTDEIIEIDWQHAMRANALNIVLKNDSLYVWSLANGSLKRCSSMHLMDALGHQKIAKLDRLIQNHSLLLDTSNKWKVCRAKVGNNNTAMLFGYGNSTNKISVNLTKYTSKHYSITLRDMSNSDSNKSALKIPSHNSIGSIHGSCIGMLIADDCLQDITMSLRDYFCPAQLQKPTTRSLLMGICGPKNSLSFPVQNSWAGSWVHSASTAAFSQIAIVAICMSLIEGVDSDKCESAMASTQVIWSKVIAYYGIQMTENPSRNNCLRHPYIASHFARLALSNNEDVAKAGKMLLFSLVERLLPKSIEILTKMWSTKLHEGMGCLSSDVLSHSVKMNSYINPDKVDEIGRKMGDAILVLCAIGISNPADLPPSEAREVCKLLLLLLKGGSIYTSFACEMLARGFFLWRPHVDDISYVLHRLLILVNSIGMDSFASPNIGARSMQMKLLIEIGTCEPTEFINCIKHEIIKKMESKYDEHRCVAIFSLTALLDNLHVNLVRFLPAIVETILCALDPSKSERRRACLAIGTRALHNIVKKFSMVSFHKESQRIGVGTIESSIIIYDLRTATKWRVLEGHTSPVNALCFTLDGKLLLSYSSGDCSVRQWPTGSTGIFGGLLSVQSHASKVYSLAPALVSDADMQDATRNCNMKVLSNRKIQLTREDRTLEILPF